MNGLAGLHANYLAERGHTLSTANLPMVEAVVAQADYIKGEAAELREAAEYINDCCALNPPKSLCLAAQRHVRNEIADVVLATVTLANILGVTVEDCIAEKTNKDRGRG